MRAPWPASLRSSSDRLAGVSEPDCLLSQIVAGELPARKVDEDQRTITLMGIPPPRAGAEGLP